MNRSAVLEQNPVRPPPAAGLALQSASLDLWDQKYRLKSRDGGIIERHLESLGMLERP